jgi:hypothetical protein
MESLIAEFSRASVQIAVIYYPEENAVVLKLHDA